MSGPRIDLTAPDIRRWRDNGTGIDFVATFESGRPGPNVVVSAVVHGNELCGAIAVDTLLERGPRPTRGVLTFVFANVGAYLNFDPNAPFSSRYIDEDFNRLWSRSVLTAPRTSAELARAREIWPIIDRADMLLDIHSMQHYCPPLMMCGMAPKGRDLAQRMGLPVRLVLDEGHSAGRRMRDYGPFSDPDDPRTALLVECGQHWEASSASVALDCAARFLVTLDMIPENQVTDLMFQGSLPEQQVIEVTEAVTIRSENFNFTEDYTGLEVIREAGTVIGQDGNEPVCTPYDNCVLIMPSRRLRPGQTAVRLGRFV